jgi:hypothetical protein
MKKIFFVFILLLCFNVNAAKCEKEELARLKNLAQQVEFVTEYDIKDKDGSKYVDFTVVAHNLNKELKVNYEKNFLTGDYKEFINDGTNVGKLSGFTSGQKIDVVIRAYTNNDCITEVLLRKKINIPYTNDNYFLFGKICNENSDFKYCSPVLDEQVSMDKFFSEFEKYTNTDANSEKTDNINNEKNNYMVFIIIGSIIVLIIIFAIVIYKKKKKNDL